MAWYTSEMKQLLAGVALLALVGIAGFLYRSALEHPSFSVTPGEGTQACTAEAKLCPDGSAVGRTGPDCAFAPCPIANTANSSSTPLTASSTTH